MFFDSIKLRARQLKQQTLTVYFAARDPRMPYHVKLLAILIAAYALSPVDLIPDFIPIFGYLDDIILVPLGLALVIRLTPPEIMESAKIKAEQLDKRPVSYSAAAFFITIWLLVLFFAARWAYYAIATQ